MPIFGSLLSSANAMRVFAQALDTIQNNVNNAATPGYAKQRLLPVPLPLAPELGLPGGIMAGGLTSSRDEYAELAVRLQQHSYGRSQQMAGELSRIEPLFDVSGQAGIPGAMNQLFQSFSSWSVAPNDGVARRDVIDRAADLAQRFNDAAAALTNAASAVNQQTRGVIGSINNLGSVISGLNAEIQRNFRAGTDANVDARLHNVLGELAQYSDFTVLKQADGSVMVLLGGQTPLVIGDRQYSIEADFSGAQTVIRDSEGRDVTAQFSGGGLSALLEVKNSEIQSYLSDLNRLASGLADRVNSILNAGVDMNGNPGAALFAYDSPETAASTLRVTSIAAEELAGAVAAAAGGNGNALDLAALANSPEIDAQTFMGFYSTLAARVGRTLATARDEAQTQEQLLLQAQALRDQSSAVSLDEEATRMMEFQRSYQAAAQVVTILNDLMDTTLNLLR